MLLVIGSWIEAIITIRMHPGRSYTIAPFVAGIMLGLGVLLLPIDLPFNRYLAAYLAMSLDITIPIGIGFWLALVQSLIWPRQWAQPTEVEGPPPPPNQEST